MRRCCWYATAQGLIGRELFAIDGVKLPSNALKAKSDTGADFKREDGQLLPCRQVAEPQRLRVHDQWHAAIKYTGAEHDGMPCEQRHLCLCTPDKTKVRQVTSFRGKREGLKPHADRG